MPNITASLPDNIMEGDSNDGFEFSEWVSNNTIKITTAPIKIITSRIGWKINQGWDI